jgi:cold-inducible RNA-binding protein
MNIYVGNLPYNITESEVQEAFAQYGQVASVTLIKDRETGQIRGFGFVEMPDMGEAQAAITALNGREMKGRSLVVNAARPREEGGGRGRQGGGGYGGGRGGQGGSRRGRPEGNRRRDSDW